MERPKLFDDDLNLDQFAPKVGSDTYEVPADTIRKIADEGGFPSRSATVYQPSTKRLPMTYRTGRTATLSVKTTPAALEAFYDVARSQGWKAGETFERAVEMLTRSVGSSHD